ncbi:unnamed protein product [Caenorhabditis brenneri]
MEVENGFAKTYYYRNRQEWKRGMLDARKNHEDGHGLRSASEPKADIVNISNEYFKRGLGNLNGIQKDRVVSKEEMDELYDMEQELLEHRRFHKNTVNYLHTKIFAKKARFIVILLTLIATGIGWAMFYHHKKVLPDSEYMILRFLVLASAYFVILQVMGVSFFSLNSDDFFKDDPKPSKHVPGVNKVYTPEILVQQQQNSADLFLKDVHPMMRRAESLKKWRFAWVRS